MEYDIDLSKQSIKLTGFKQSYGNMNRRDKITEMVVFLIMLFMMIYPGSAVGVSTYIPYYLVGIFVLFDIFRKGNIYIQKYLLAFIVWSLFINLAMTSINNLGLFYSVRSSIGIIFPLLAFMLGRKYSKLIVIKSFSKVVFIMLVIQSIVVYLQMSGTNIGLETYWIYAGEKGLGYLKYLSYGDVSYRALGTIGNPNELGVFVVLLVAFLMFCDSLKKPYIVVFALSGAYIVFFSQSRTAVILFSVMMFVRVLYSKDRLSLKIIIKVFLGLGVMMAILIYAANNLGRPLLFDQLIPRFILWENAWDMVYSFNDEINFALVIFGRGISYVKGIGSIDNTYFNVMVSSGLIGLSLFIMFIYKLVFQSIKMVNKKYRFLVYSYIIIFVISCSVMDVYFNMKVSFLIFFICGYLLNYNE